MKIVVTGGNGFIARNLLLRLGERGYTEVVSLTRGSSAAEWEKALLATDVVFHLAGVNRPGDEKDFEPGNAGLTSQVCDALARGGRCATIVLSSSTQATRDNPYGRSKLEAETTVEAYAARTGARGCVCRFPNVFGKWALPDYNSAIATFCHNIARGLPIRIGDASAPLQVMHVDDAVDAMLALLPPSAATGMIALDATYETTVGEVVAMIRGFAEGRRLNTIDRVGSGLTRVLYSTYVSYLPPVDFAYSLDLRVDSRGSFAEMLRTSDSGQVSFFTGAPGRTRGEHYHHTKTEKFLVVVGTARFDFRHMVSGERHVIDVDASEPRIVESVPGWAHCITNTGESDIVVLLWANEIFDPQHPDTFATKVRP